MIGFLQPDRLRALASDAVATGTAALRSGLLSPVLPRPALLGVLARAPFRTPNFGTAVAVHAALRPTGVALIDDAGALTFRGLQERTNRLANALLEVAEPGDRVAFMLRNGREHVECYTACGLAGMVAVPVNTWSSADDVAHIADRQRIAVIVADREFADAVDGLDVTTWWVGDGGDYERVLDRASDAAPTVRGGARIVTHTSGTTGRPKGAERDVGGGVVAVFLSFLEKVPLRRDDVFYIAPPLFHQLGQAMLGIGLALGTTLLLRRRFDADDFLTTAIVNGATAAVLLPVMVKRIVDLDSSVPTPDLRLVVVSGSAFPPALRDRAQRRLGPVFYDLYGSTEAGWATIATPEDHRQRPGSVGRAARGTRLLIVDDDGNALAPGEVGRIHVASAFAFEGYTDAEADQSVVEGALEIGDRGYLDEQGYLFVTGRTDDMIVSGGENIYPSEVEGALEQHPHIADNAVVGVDDEEFGQVLHAFVVRRDGADLGSDDVKRFVRKRLTRYKAPKRVTFVDELPRNATGKVLKDQLREAAGADA